MKKYLPVLLFLLFNTVITYAQNLDSLYNLFLQIRTGEDDPKAGAVYSDENFKCGFGLVNELILNINSFPEKERRIINKFTERPVTQTSIVTPNGRIRIHYDLTGAHAPVYDINELARALDTVYNFEIEQLGYPPPPDDGNEGGDGLYDIYIQDLNRGMYGYTQIETEISNDKYTSFTVMENAYEGYFSEGILGAKVTAAHEFHHAIQIGNYLYRTEDLFFYEITSVSMEEFVFDYVNDYYDYLPYYFNYPERTFSTRHSGLDGYDLAIWNLYLKEKFGYDFIKSIWERMRDDNNRALAAMANLFEENGTSFKKVLNEFGVWTYFTSHRAKPGEYFEEAEYYPLIRPMGDYNYSPPSSMGRIIYSEPLSNNFLVYSDISRGADDTLVAIITNGDVANAISSDYPKLEFEFTLFGDHHSNAKQINDYYSYHIDCAYDDYLSTSFIFNDEVVTDGNNVNNETDFVFPQPYRYSNSEYNFMRIPVAPNETGNAVLNIYSVSMNLVYSGDVNIYGGSRNYVKWSGLSDDKEKLPTGVYIYVTKSGDKIKKGKVVIYNE